ncbi:hypothetical protein [Streptomyces muensis]|uniref:Secreted protein n=1 Tax=Streptomyces muensis TaxID=1077944 RepID=A0A9X1Q7B5_STRM4|nr:hypothetical protein [Streptomyces muensis]MCF1599388.1 hypothetical protein [Streptomyces muensis]
MKATQRLAALTGSAALVLTGLTTLTATPAAAATCHNNLKVEEAFGKVTFSRCYRDTSLGSREFKVQGTVTDTKTDGCNVRVTFKFKHSSAKYETGSSRSFTSLWHIGIPSVSLSKVC